jgi:probable F420-dependent oxidoreductase
MSVGVFVSAGFMPESDVLRLAPEIERLGFDGMTFPEHLFVTEQAEGAYPGTPDGKAPFRHSTPWPDPLVLIGALGPMTTTLRFMPTVQVIALRHPVALAKTAATTARLCDGRLSIGVGVGWLRDEFDVLGVDFERRGAITNESIDVMRKLWQPGVAEHSGEFFSLPQVRMEPRPPRIPILIGGDSDAALRRAAKRGDGYILPTRTFADVPKTLGRLRERLEAVGREPSSLEIFMPALDAPAETILSALDPMINNITVMPWVHPGKEETSLEDKLERLERYAESVLGPLRAHVATR